MSDAARRRRLRGGRLSGALLAVYFALAPSTVPAWRLDSRFRPVAVLHVGEPTRALGVRPPA